MDLSETLTDDEVREAWLIGCADDVIAVEGSEPESAVRVSRYILWTDSQGNDQVIEYPSEDAAERRMGDIRQSLYGDGLA